MDLPGHAEDVRVRAYDSLLDRTAIDRAYRVARLILGDPVEAEDATHDAALAAWRHLGELRDPSRFDAWFGRILVHACRDRLRARRRLPITIDARGVDPLGGATGDLADAVTRRDLLLQAIRGLSLDHREVIVLRFYADLTIDQIAERTGTPPGTVKSRLHHALRRLRAEIDEAGSRRAGR